MARPTGGTGGTVHVGKAAAIIVVAALIGVLVLYKDGGGSSSLSAAERAALTASASAGNTTTTAAKNTDNESTPTTAALRAPAEVKVVAINGTTTPKLGAKATTKLQASGYNALAPGDAKTKSATATSVIYVVTAGYEREAAAIAAIFGLPASAVRAVPSPAPSTAIKPGVNIAVFIGTGITL